MNVTLVTPIVKRFVGNFNITVTQPPVTVLKPTTVSLTRISHPGVRSLKFQIVLWLQGCVLLLVTVIMLVSHSRQDAKFLVGARKRLRQLQNSKKNSGSSAGRPVDGTNFHAICLFRSQLHFQAPNSYAV